MPYRFTLSPAMCTDGDVRLAVSEETDTFYMGLSNYDESYYDKGGLRVGRVEVCRNGIYGTICIDTFDNLDASVVCSQSGFSRHGVLQIYMSASRIRTYLNFSGAIAVNADTFREGQAPRFFTGVQCLGNESNLFQCGLTNTTDDTCTTSGVICQGEVYVCIYILKFMKMYVHSFGYSI